MEPEAARYSRSSTMSTSPSIARALPGVDVELMRSRAYVGGRWVDHSGGARLTVEDPATGRVIGSVPNLGPHEVRQAITAATEAQAAWSRRTVHERAVPLIRWARLMDENRDALAHLMTHEQGKPLAEARGEIDYASGFLSWFAEEAKRNAGEIIPTHLPGKRLFALRVPVGVAAAVTPWNFPSAMITRKAGAALAAGCAIIVKPASETPYSALALAVLAERAGIPPGLFSVVTGDPQPIVTTLLDATVVRHLSFTGSTEVGRLLMRHAADTVKKVALELGGHAPFIVFEDADLDAAVSGAMVAKFQTSGQDCLAANRFLVHQSLYQAFCERLAGLVRELRVGDGFDPGAQIGPLINRVAVLKCQAHVDDARQRGARLLAGGHPHAKGPNFFSPTLLVDAGPEMRIWREETFGPVAAVGAFDDDLEAQSRANDSEYGLAAYCYGRDLARLWRTAERLEFGMVAINTARMTGPSIPFGGVKQSGLGREGGRQGLEEYTQTRYICVDGIDSPAVVRP